MLLCNYVLAFVTSSPAGQNTLFTSVSFPYIPLKVCAMRGVVWHISRIFHWVNLYIYIYIYIFGIIDYFKFKKFCFYNHYPSV